ncbi:hypothetical protein [Streptomyces sp.]|uniref:hypothetical protein n=1 Tax=Streptomyces sp. TaxID=1931 RepID=UPI002D64E729|nr:hypothetical protein [Streptomyces sp.]HZF87621.1 hypothetical protein [Streptomyces sp.]
MRHFFASTALANGVPIHEVSRWLGHRSVKTTVDIYRHLLPGAWERCRGLAALHAATAPGRDVPAVRGGELERLQPGCLGVRGLAGLRGAGIERPCWDGAGKPTAKPVFPQVGALHYRFRFNV